MSLGRLVPRTTTAGVASDEGTAARMGPVGRVTTGTEIAPPSMEVSIPSGALISAYSASRARSRSTSSAKVDFMNCIRSLRLKMLSEVMRKRCSSSARSLAYWKRSSGSLARALSTMRSRASGIFRL